MKDVLLIIHFVGLMMGAGGGLGSTVVMAYAKSQGPKGGPIRAVGPALANLSGAGVVVMIASGFLMIFITYDVFALPVFFWLKMLFVVSLSFAALTIQATYAKVKRGDKDAARILPVLGPMAGLSALMATIFAVLTFH